MKGSRVRCAVFVAADAHVGGGIDEHLVQLPAVPGPCSAQAVPATGTAWAQAPRQVFELGFRLATVMSQVTTVTQSMVKASEVSNIGQKCSARAAMVTEPTSATMVPPMNPCLVDIASGYARVALERAD